MTVAFDTLKFAQTLRDKANVPQEQAEGMAQAFADATGEELATKADLRETEQALKAALREMELTLKAELKQTEASLTAMIKQRDTSLTAMIKDAKFDTLKWMIGLIGFQTVAIIGAAVVIIHFR